MADFPTGTVTFLFTDVEGSTHLLQELGPEAYGAALLEHRRVLRECFSRRGGIEVDTQGDAFLVAFSDAQEAVAAAAESQVELAPGPISVRMGLHTGTPHVTGEGYVGEDVHLGARIASAAHGGQVLLSAATRAAVEPGNTLFLGDLGEHRFKDFDDAVAIVQLGEQRFPPLRTISNTNLPRPASSFLGREREVAEVLDLVRGGTRLVTLTGPGGTGKTRLGIETAAELVGEFKAGVFWVPLATIRDPRLVSETIEESLGATNGLAAHIGERQLLILLDNFEQVVDAAPELSPTLAACPNLRLLVTSRELLRLQGEIEYAVPPLAGRDAAKLFCARSRLDADEEIAELCGRLDNLPLAVELAAARTSVLTPSQIVERLGGRLDLLKGGRDADPRQQTLRATIEWSHDLLTLEEQGLFARLSVFAGGCTLTTAEAVVDADLETLQSLVDKSLVRRTGDRFWMLETIREFSVERLRASGEEEAINRCLAAYLLALGESANLSAESEGREDAELVRPELDNFRHTIEWAREADPELALRLAVSLEQFWMMNDPFEGVRVLRSLLEASQAAEPVLRARVLRTLGESTWIAGDYETGAQLMQECLEAFERLGDERAVAVVLQRLGVCALVENDFVRGRQLFEQSLDKCRSSPNPRLEADVLHKLGWVERYEGNPERALELFEESALLLERVGFTWMQAGALLDQAELLHEFGKTDLAEERAAASLRLSRQISDRQGTVYGLAMLARLASATGRPGRAGRLWGAVESEETHGPVGQWDGERDEREAAVVSEDPLFVPGVEEGRRLSLDEAVAYALSID